MWKPFHDGGWGMYPTLVFGLVAAGAALRYVIRGDGRLRGVIESMVRAVLFVGLAGFVTGLVATSMYILQFQVRGDEVLRTFLIGLGEASYNLALAFTMVSLTHVIVALGRRRQDARELSNP